MIDWRPGDIAVYRGERHMVTAIEPASRPAFDRAAILRREKDPLAGPRCALVSMMSRPGPQRVR